MKNQRKIGKIAIAILLFAFVAVYLWVNFYVFENVLFSLDWLHLFASMFIYALIPFAPAVFLRMKFKIHSARWLSYAATFIAAICLVIIVINAETMFDGNENEWYYDFAQYALISSVPVLYCIAFFGSKKDAWIAVFSPLAYFLSFFARYAVIFGLAETFSLLRYFDLDFIFRQNPNPFILMSLITAIVMCLIFFLWAIFCIFISRMAYKIAALSKEKNKNRTGRRK